MPAEHTEELSRFAFEGPLTSPQGIVLGCVLAALAFWALFRTPKGAPRRFGWLLWLLRIGAIAVLIWMLLGPVNVTVFRHYTPKSLAVVVDVSESMTVYDPPDNKAVARWHALEQPGPSSQWLSTCDKAAVAAATARDNLDRLLREGAGLQPKDRARRRLESAGRALAETIRLSDELCRLLEDGQDALAGEFLSRAKEISTGLGTVDAGDMTAIADNAKSDSFVLGPEETGQIETWQRQLSYSARALAGLADRIAAKFTEGGENSPSDPGQRQSLARGQRVERLLDVGKSSWLAPYVQTARIRRYTFDRDTVSAADEKGTGDAIDKKKTPDGADKEQAARSPFTNLSGVLERIAHDAGPEHIETTLIFTDGRHNDPAARDPRDVAKLLGSTQFHMVPIGTSEMRKDLVLHHVEAPTAIVEGDQVVVEAIVSAYSAEGETAVIELTEGENVVDRREIEIASIRHDYHVRFTTSPKGTGRHEYALTIHPVTGESVPTNNAETFGVDIVDAKLRILLADDFPRWEYRYLINILERSERLEYDQMLFHPSQRSSGELNSTARLPRDVDGWARYRVAILGDVGAAEFDAESQKSLKDFVSVRGGTAIIIAGAQSMPNAYAGMPLADLIPVSAAEFHDSAQGYQLELSPEGKQTSAMEIADEPGMSEQVWKDMSRQLPVYSLSQYCVPKATARTLIRAIRTPGEAQSEGEQKAFLCWQTVGRGRVVYIAAPTIYQLRMKYGDRYHHRFWGQLIRWSVARDLSQGSKTVKLASDRSRVAVGDALQVIANLSTLDGQPVLDAEVRAEAKMNDTSAALIELKPDANIPGRYLGEYAPASEGTLTLQAFGADVTQLLQTENYGQNVETSVIVDPTPSTETEDTRSNTPLLRQIASLTGGQVVQPTAVEEIVALTDLEPRIDEQTVRGPLWNRWIFLWLITGLLTIEWAVRKTTGRP